MSTDPSTPADSPSPDCPYHRRARPFDKAAWERQGGRLSPAVLLARGLATGDVLGPYRLLARMMYPSLKVSWWLTAALRVKGAFLVRLFTNERWAGLRSTRRSRAVHSSWRTWNA